MLGDRGGGVDVDSEEILSGHVRKEPQVRVRVVFMFVLILFSQVLVDQVLEKQSSQHRHAVPQGLSFFPRVFFSHSLLQICCHPYLLKGAEATEAANCKTQQEVCQRGSSRHCCFLVRD